MWEPPAIEVEAVLADEAAEEQEPAPPPSTDSKQRFPVLLNAHISNLFIATGKDDAVFDFANELVSNLDARDIRVLFDDRRGVSPGVKFNDSELIGVPTIVVVGRGLADGVVEVKDRASGEREEVDSAVIVDHLVSLVRS